jgi:hypothetical protein
MGGMQPPAQCFLCGSGELFGRIRFFDTIAIIIGMSTKKYVVFVDDNYHYGDKNERYKLGEFDTRGEAVEACKRTVNEYFERLEKGKYSFEELWGGYMMYGEDPFIMNDDEGSRFSAWDYAKERCREFAA